MYSLTKFYNALCSIKWIKYMQQCTRVGFNETVETLSEAAFMFMNMFLSCRLFRKLCFFSIRNLKKYTALLPITTQKMFIFQ